MVDTTRITNLTDVPGPFKLVPHHLDLFNQSLEPGEGIAIPTRLVDKKLRLMAEKTGKIGIGPLPAYYTEAKAIKGKTLTKEEAIRRLQTSPPAPEVKAESEVEMEADASMGSVVESPRSRSRRRE